MSDEYGRDGRPGLSDEYGRDGRREMSRATAARSGMAQGRSKVIRMMMGLVGLALLFLGCAHTPAWELPPPLAEDRPVVDGTRLQRSQLANGLEVITLVDRRLPRFDMGLMVRRGAGIVPIEQAGLAGFTAELMERGAGERDALALAGVVDSLGATHAVSADWDSVSVAVSGLSRDFTPLFDVLADLVRRPRFDVEEAGRVQAETLASLEKAREDPSTLASWNFAKALYGSHPYGLPSSGTPETAKKLDAAQARAFYQQVFVPGNAVLYAVGDIDPVEIRTRAEAAFGDWPTGPIPEPGAPPPMRTKPGVVIVDRPDLGQAQVVIGHPGIKRTEERRIPVQVMNTVLGSAGFSSRLMGRIRAEEGLTYGIRSQYASRRQTGPFVVASFTRVPKVSELVRLSLLELERIRSEPPSTQEVADAKSLLAGRFALGLETSSAVLGSLVDLNLYGLPEDSLDTYRGRIRALTEAEVAAAAQDFVRPEEAIIVIVGPAAPIQEQLGTTYGPVEVVQP